MRTPDPTIDDILNDYFNCGICTITYKNGQAVTGIFTHLPDRPTGKITYWQFIPYKEKPMIRVFHDQIALIERPD